MRHTIALRTEALFRSSGRIPRGPFPAQERAPRRRLRREVPGPPGPGRDERAVRVLRDPRARAGDGEPLVDLVAGPTTGGVILAFETARQLGVRASSPRRSAATTATIRREFRRGFRIEPRRAGPARRRHPDDRRLAARDAPGGRGDGRRDRRVRRAGRPERRPGDAHLAGDRAGLPAALALAARPADLRARPGDVPALRRRHAAPRPWQHRHRHHRSRPAAPAEHRGPAWIGAHATCSRSPSVAIVA